VETCILVGFECTHEVAPLLRQYYRALVSLDRHMSQMLGRPCAIQDEECAHVCHCVLTDLNEYILALILSFQLTAMTSTGKILTQRRLSNNPRANHRWFPLLLHT
jgi:hypothetical protein